MTTTSSRCHLEVIEMYLYLSGDQHHSLRCPLICLMAEDFGPLMSFLGPPINRANEPTHTDNQIISLFEPMRAEIAFWIILRASITGSLLFTHLLFSWIHFLLFFSSFMLCNIPPERSLFHISLYSHPPHFPSPRTAQSFFSSCTLRMTPKPPINTHQYSFHWTSSKMSSGMGSISTRSDTCLWTKKKQTHSLKWRKTHRLPLWTSLSQPGP